MKNIIDLIKEQSNISDAFKESLPVHFCLQCGEELSESYSHCEDHLEPRTITAEERTADEEAREADRWIAENGTGE